MHLTVVVVALFLLYYFYRFVRLLYYANKIPGVWNSPHLQGIGILFKMGGRDEVQRLKVLRHYIPQYLKNGKIFFGPFFGLLLHDPEWIQKVYNCSELMQKPRMYKFFGWGNGLITSDISIWRVHRKILNNAFTLPALQSFLPIFDESSKTLVQELESKVGKGPFNFLEYMTKCTFDSICATSFGTHVNAQKNHFDFNYHQQRVHMASAARIFNVHYHIDSIYKLSAAYKDDMESRKFCEDFAVKIIQERERIITKSDTNNNSDEEVESYKQSKKTMIFIDHLIKSKEDGKIFTENEIRDHALTLLSAGHDTTALAVSYTLLLLAMHPDLQEKAYQEISDLFDGPDTPFTMENLRKLEYLELVVKETLRLCPSVPAMARYATEDTMLDGVLIPAGTYIYVHIFILHRLKLYWGDDADEFNPDRFLPENSKNRHSHCFIPFGTGPRSCIGQKYAYLSIKASLVRLLMAYKFETHLKLKDLEYRMDIVTTITGGHLVQIKKRE